MRSGPHVRGGSVPARSQLNVEARVTATKASERQGSTAFLARWRRGWCVALGGTLLWCMAAGGASAEPILNIAGSTLGCFGTVCDAFGSPAVSDPAYGLTFTGGVFTGATDATGAIGDIFLGSFSRGNVNVSSSLPPLDFTLEVVFTLPTVLSHVGTLVTASINGANHGGGGPSVLFDHSWHLFEFTNELGYGWFEFAVVSDLRVPKNNSRDLFGSIRNATFTPLTPGPEQLLAVPEPSGLILLGAGIAGVLARRGFRPGPARTT
jgi:hypothetical protein